MLPWFIVASETSLGRSSRYNTIATSKVNVIGDQIKRETPACKTVVIIENLLN